MGRYVIITNLWGREANKYSGWNYRVPDANPRVCESERVEFDTISEVDEYIKLFDEFCSSNYTKAQRVEGFKWLSNPSWRLKELYDFKSPHSRAWGWLIGDRETQKLTWGGEKLCGYNSRTDRRELKDILFRGPDEIPKDYKWDDGEYEGWLQYRWGDGKNAVGYVDNPKSPTKKNQKEDLSTETDEYEDIEDRYSRIEEKDLKKKLEDRW